MDLKAPWKYEYGEVYAANGDVIARRDVIGSPRTLPTERDAILRAMSATPDLIASIKRFLTAQTADAKHHAMVAMEEALDKAGV
jgi:hypothetical protein